MRTEIEGTTPDELVDRITDAVCERLRPILEQATKPQSSTPNTRRLVDIREMARIGSSSESTIARLTASGVVPSVLLGSSRRYDPDTVIESLERHTAKRQAEVQAELDACCPHRPEVA